MGVIITTGKKAAKETLGRAEFSWRMKMRGVEIIQKLTGCVLTGALRRLIVE